MCSRCYLLIRNFFVYEYSFFLLQKLLLLHKLKRVHTSSVSLISDFQLSFIINLCHYYCYYSLNSMAALTIVLLVYSLSIVFGRFSFLHHGNELEQFAKYEQLTGSLLNVSEFFTATDACEKATIPENGFRSYMCRYKLREQREKVMTPLWSRHIDSNQKYKMDCKYKLQILEPENLSKFAAAVIENGVISFEVEQFGCHSNLAISGGSTFEIYLKSTRHLAVCNVVDQFNHKYTVYCPLPHDFKTNSVATVTPLRLPAPAQDMTYVCSDISVNLHYEHFDAFDDIGHSKFSSLHHNVYKGPVCAQFPSSAQPTTHQEGIVAATSDDKHSDPLWLIRPFNSPDKKFYFNEKLHASIFGENTIYEWRGQTPKYLTVSAMKHCLKRQTLWFVGESHMRYQFDITMDRYVDKLNMGRYHGSVNVSGVSYADNTFSTRLIAMLDNLPCPRSADEKQQLQTLVLQTGSWDLQFFPPRAFIRNPSQGLCDVFVFFCVFFLFAYFLFAY